MKKSLLLVFGLIMMVTLSACGSKEKTVVDEGNVVPDNQENSISEVTKKTSLTEDDLVNVERENLPVSYTYQLYLGDDNTSIDSGSYIYTTSESEKLIPEFKDMSSRKILSSSLEDGFIYTVSEVTLRNGNTIVVSYVNDPDSLKYLAAVVENSGNVVLYNFSY